MPCHRVVGSTGALTGYHWGVPRKRAILGWEAGVIAPGSSSSGNFPVQGQVAANADATGDASRAMLSARR